MECSVVITTQGNIEYLSRCVKSILRQTFPISELVIVNDGGNKLELSELGLCSRNLQYIHNEIARGANFARKAGIEKSKNDYIFLMDDDDYWEEHKVETVMEHIKSNPKYIDYLITHRVYLDDEKTRIAPKRIYKTGSDPSVYLFVKTAFGKHTSLLQTSTFSAKKSTFKLLDIDEELKRHQDWDLVINAFNNSIPIIMIEDILGTWYQPEKSLSKTPDYLYSIDWIINQPIKRSTKAHFYYNHVIWQMRKSGSLYNRNNLSLIIYNIIRFPPNFIEICYISVQFLKGVFNGKSKYRG